MEPQQQVDERAQRRREYSGPASTLGVAALVVLAVGAAIWAFEFRTDSPKRASEAGMGVLALDDAANPTGRPPAAEVGRAAPDFKLASPDGSVVQLTAYRGRFVLVNFWATWCEPCRTESPDLQALADRRADTVVVLGVNQQEQPGPVSGFLREFAIRYPVGLDRDAEVSNAYRVGRGLPVTFLVDPKGVIRSVTIGRLTDQDFAAIESELDR